MARKYEIDMTTGSIPKKVLQFAIPLMLTNVLSVLFHSADTVIVGRFAGSMSMAAVGSTGSLVNLLTNLFLNISIGANVLCARYFGSHEYDKLRKCSHSAVALGAALGFLVCMVGFFLSTPLLRLIKADEAVLPLSSLYLKIFFLGSPASMTYSFSAAVLRALGDTDRPLRFMILSGIVNIILNLLFVIVLRMDVAGVALATVISHYLSAFLVLRCLMKTDGPHRVELKKLSFDSGSVRDIIQTGLPAGLNATVFSFANITIQSAVNSLGPIAMAGNAAASSVDSIVYTGGIGAFHTAATSFASQNLGARRYDRISKVLGTCLIMVTASTLLLGGLARLFGESLLGLYVPVNDPDRTAVISMGLIRLTWIALPYFLCGIMDVACGVLRGLGHNWGPMAISLLGACGLRILWVKTAFAAAPSLRRLYLCYPLSWICVFLVYLCILIPNLYKLKKQAFSSPCN